MHDFSNNLNCAKMMAANTNFWHESDSFSSYHSDEDTVVSYYDIISRGNIYIHVGAGISWTHLLNSNNID